MRLGVWVLAIGVAPAGVAHAQTTEGPIAKEFRFAFGLFGGTHMFSKDHALGRFEGDPPQISPATAPVMGGQLGLSFNRWVGLEGELSVSRTHILSGKTDLSVFGYRGSLVVHLAEHYVFRPFILLGYGGLTSLVNDETAARNDNMGFLHAGGGFKIGFTDRIGLRLEGRVLAPWTILSPTLPAGGRPEYTGPDVQLLGSLFINFGEILRSQFITKKEVTVIAPPPTPKDPDGDGIVGTADKCPQIAEDLDGFQDSDGCPDPDNDNDGIPDLRDSCPSDAEDKDGFADDDGCPDPDNDNDGIPDGRDKCPGEAEDKDSFADDDGCPDPDNDADGIVDARDKCPNQAETKNNYQDDDGCPDEVPAAVKKFTGVIEGINFKTASSEILPGSFTILDRALQVLQDYPDVNLEISGHTDDRGNADYNRDLSQRRAEAVRYYFIRRGLDARRLRSIGYGEDRPVADNGSESGRARNRRTEFRLVGADGQ